jgi:hypothetical protein
MSFILDAIKGFGEWIWNGLVAIGNAITSALTWLFQTIFVNPIVGLFNAILNKIREKIKGIIFIVTTVPWTIREARALMEKPSLKGFVKLAMKPLLGYAVSEITYALISPYLKPVTITPPMIPSIAPFPSAPTPPFSATDYVRINDYLSTELTDIVGLSDRISVDEEVSIETYETYSMSDSVSIEEWLTLTLQ